MYHLIATKSAKSMKRTDGPWTPQIIASGEFEECYKHMATLSTSTLKPVEWVLNGAAVYSNDHWAYHIIEDKAPPKAETATKYSDEQLKVAFEKVQNKEHWKNPIDAKIKLEDRAIVEEAVIYFTGSVPTFTAVGKKLLRVKAAGYYSAIGS